MAISALASVGGPRLSPSVEGGARSFAVELAGKEKCPTAPSSPAKWNADQQKQVASPPGREAALAARALDRVSSAQKRLDQVLGLAQSGRSFTAGELLSLQANVYRASQELDLAGKVIEKATSGVKQVLQTQV